MNNYIPTPVFSMIALHTSWTDICSSNLVLLILIEIYLEWNALFIREHLKRIIVVANVILKVTLPQNFGNTLFFYVYSQTQRHFLQEGMFICLDVTEKKDL